MKLCTDCHFHHEIPKSLGSESLEMLTSHFGMTDYVHACRVEDIHDPVDGKQCYRYCKFMRSDKGPCGPDAKLFKPNEEPE